VRWWAAIMVARVLSRSADLDLLAWGVIVLAALLVVGLVAVVIRRFRSKAPRP